MSKSSLPWEQTELHVVKELEKIRTVLAKAHSKLSELKYQIEYNAARRSEINRSNCNTKRRSGSISRRGKSVKNLTKSSTLKSSIIRPEEYQTSLDELKQQWSSRKKGSKQQGKKRKSSRGRSKLTHDYKAFKNW